MKNSTPKKTVLLFLFSALFFVGKVSAQLPSLTVTVTNSTNCSAPCNGTASVPTITGATYMWNDGQTTPTATGLCAGTYSITATLSIYSTGGTGTVWCCTGVANISVDDNITLYPNPAHNELYLQINSSLQGKVNFTVRNILGMAVYQEAIETNGSLYKWIDISVLPTGIYAVEFVNGTQTIQKKFIKQ